MDLNKRKPPMRAPGPIKRQYLGTFDVRGKKIAIFVNAEMLAYYYGQKAVDAKSQRVKLADGAVLIRTEVE